MTTSPGASSFNEWRDCWLRTPADEALAELTRELKQEGNDLEGPDAWPGEQLDWCARQGVFRWFLPESAGGAGWSAADLMRSYVRLASACLTTAFVLTQRNGACRRIASAENTDLPDRLLPDLISGHTFATLGISHLTTSRQHARRPVMRATETSSGFRLDGYTPWVTGAPQADFVVAGATLEDQRQVLVVVPMQLEGIQVEDHAPLTALTASQTAMVKFDGVEVGSDWILAGPERDIMLQGVGGNTGGLQTSALALGLAHAAIAFVEHEGSKRPELRQAAAGLRDAWRENCQSLVRLANDEPVCSRESLRTSSNSLTLRATQAALAAAKGAGYVLGHPAGRWCREALFFLVWSCPQAVLHANLCEFAGVES